MLRKYLMKSEILVAVSFAFVGLWVTLVLTLQTSFQSTASIDPLAMIHVLFPYFWILTIGISIISIAVVFHGNNSKWVHIILLSTITLILFYTPFALGGFSWEPDSLWHGGVAKYMPEVLSGTNKIALPASDLFTYAKSYPFSYLITYCVQLFSGIDVFLYTLLVYPLICIVSLVSLSYLFAARLFDRKVAFLSMLLMLPALHYVEPHVSPNSLGTILVLVVLLLLTMKPRVSLKIAIVLTIVALTLTHPISPASLGVFLLAVGLFGLSARAFPENRKPNSAYSSLKPLLSRVSPFSNLFIMTVIWSVWTFFWAGQKFTAVVEAVVNVLSLKFLVRIQSAFNWTASGNAFIYPDIHNLTLAIYAIFLVASLALLLWGIGQIKFARGTTTKESDHLMKRTVLAFVSLAFIPYSYMLILARGDPPTLLGRGLFFFLLMASISMSAYLASQNHRGDVFRKSITVILILVLFLSFPIVSYSKEAYNTFTPSTDYGLRFIGIYCNVSQKSLSMGYVNQITAYANASLGIVESGFPPRLNETSPDTIVLRISYFFKISMETDFSFTNNSFIQLRNNLTENIGYDKVYSSGTFDVYSSIESGQPR